MSARHFSFHLLGPLRLLVGDAEAVGLRSRKALALLAYLALEARPVPRLTAATLLWPALPEPRARANLSWSLNHLKMHLPGTIEAGRSALSFRLPPGGWLDTRAFEGLAASGRPEDALAALDLVQGELLAGFLVDGAPEWDLWLTTERERWRQRIVTLVVGQLEAVLARGEADAALPLAERWVALAPWREEAHRWLMRSQAAAGRRRAALAQFELCRRILHQELDVEPAPETVALRDEIARPARGALPRLTTPFFGRQAEISQIDAFLTGPERLLTIFGPGGVGKSRLAIEALQRAGEAAAGAVFVPLAAARRPEEAVETIARLLGLAGQPAPERIAREAHLLDALAAGPALLLLDNLEQLAGAASLIARLLAGAPELRVLATSRHRLDLQAERILSLGGLPYPLEESAEGAAFPAVQLFEERLRRRLPAYAPDAGRAEVVALCRLVRGHPLALELAAARAADRPLADLLAALRASPAALGADLADLPARHVSIRALFDHSWELLSAPEQRALARLTVFPAPFTPAAARVVAGAPATTLADLAARSLLQREGERYDLHPLVRDYAAARLGAGAARRVRLIHARHTLDWVRGEEVELCGPEPARARARLDDAFDHVTAALVAAAEQEEIGAIHAALPALFRAISRWRPSSEGTALFKRAAAALPERRAATRDLLELCAINTRPRRTIPAADGRRAAGLLDRIPTGAPERAFALLLGGRALSIHDPAAAAGVLAGAIEELHARGDLRGEAEARLAAGSALAPLGRLAEAGARFETALALFGRAGDSLGRAGALYSLARLALERRQTAEAQRLVEEARLLYTRLEQPRGMQRCQAALGMVAHHRGAFDDASHHFRSSLALAEAQGNWNRVATDLGNLGVSHCRAGRYDEAARWLARALDEYGRLGSEGGRSLVLHNLGVLADARRDTEAAIAYTRAALAIPERQAHAGGRLHTRTNLGYFTLTAGRPQEAREQFAAVLADEAAGDEPAFLLGAVAGLAMLLDAPPLDRRLVWAGHVLAAPTCDPFVRERLQGWLDILRDSHPAAALDAALSSGRDLALPPLLGEVTAAIGVG